MYVAKTFTNINYVQYVERNKIRGNSIQATFQSNGFRWHYNLEGAEQYVGDS